HENPAKHVEVLPCFRQISPANLSDFFNTHGIFQRLRCEFLPAGDSTLRHSKILCMIDETHQTWSNIVDAIRRAEISYNKTGAGQRLSVSLRSNGIGITQPGTSLEIRVEL